MLRRGLARRPIRRRAVSSIAALDLVHVPFNGGAGVSPRSSESTLRSASARPRIHSADQRRQRARACNYEQTRSQILPDVRPWLRPAIRRSEGDSWWAFSSQRNPKDIISLLIARSSGSCAAGHEGAIGRTRLRPDREHAGGICTRIKVEIENWARSSSGQYQGRVGQSGLHGF